MEEIENQSAKKPRVKSQFNHESQNAFTVIVSFVLSIFLILFALIILVRFWVFENILYNLFVLSFFTIGVMFNIASVNLTLVEYPESLHITPFVFLTPITIFWSVLCITMRFFKHDFFSQFAQLPITTYDHGFYDGLGYNPNKTTIHPFEKPFINKNSLFENTPLFIMILVILTIMQLMLWINSINFYYKIKCEENKLSKIKLEESKEN
ncbi:hypothetical protein PVAND_008767 [Polypedilum vanderplanki]|uniref:Transmembrane protein n=1 Tax=Polypedilum vanderplanki TaxID=319348 RepID=A0A9J6CAL6_POLVA|nr:hypothetical protein PVAND_008767 [Polypedilum vanderplanki]